MQRTWTALVAEDYDRGRGRFGGGGHSVVGSNPRLLFASAYDTRSASALAGAKRRLVSLKVDRVFNSLAIALIISSY